MNRDERPYLTDHAIRITAACCMLAAALTAHAHASPSPTEEPTPNYPDLRYFTQIDSAPYAQSEPSGATLPDQPGYWFITAQGLSCGIWFRGSFGCSGAIPGAPTNVHQIGWITGDTRVHYDWTLSSRFPRPLGSAPIPPLSFINVEGTKCGTTSDNSTYCERGPWRMLVTADHTRING